MQAPAETWRQFHSGRAGGSRTGPAQECAEFTEFNLDLGPEVKRGTDVAIAAIDLIDNVDDTGCSVKQDRSTMSHRRVEPEAAVVLSRPLGDVAVIEDLSLPGVRATGPQVQRPRRIAGVAVRPRVGEDVHSAVADLHGESHAIRVLRDPDGSVGSTMAATPDLRELIVAGSTEHGRAERAALTTWRRVPVSAAASNPSSMTKHR